MKERYVYELYKAKDGTIHCEPRPIIYFNAIYVYYKTTGSETLDYINRDHIYKNLDELMNKVYLCQLNYLYHFILYEKPDMSVFDMRSLIKEKTKQDLLEKKQKYYSKVKSYQIEYDRVCEELKKLEEES